jgi:two-component system cell cycle sensor histidine kinase/response regulator CckA
LGRTIREALIPRAPTLSLNQLRPLARPHYLRWVRAGLSVALVGYLIVAVTHAVVAPARFGDWASEATATGLIAVALVILERGHPLAAARLTLAAIWLEFHFSFVKDGAVVGPALAALPAFIVGAGLLAGGRAALVIACTTAVTVPLAIGAHHALLGQPLLPAPGERLTLVVLAVVLVAVGLLLHLALRSFSEVVAEAQASARRLAELVKAVPDGVVALDREGRVTSVNPAAEEVLGTAERELRGRPLLDVLRELSSPDATFPAPADLRGVVTLRHRDGRTVDAEVTTHPTDDPDGPVGTLGMLRDVTERRRAEERQAELQRRLLHAQKLEAVGQFAGGVAHDFNNLLHALSANLEIARVTVGAGSAATPFLDEIGTAASRAAALVQQLLAYTRRQVSAPRNVDLSTTVRGVESLLRRLLPADIAVEMDAPAGLGVVRADRGQIEQVVVNLAVNARDAMPGGGRLRIALSRRDLDPLEASMLPGLEAGPHVELAVSDSGTGMSAEVQSRLFEPFFTTKRDGSGSGLGLATVYGIVKQAEGHIGVESRPGHGSTFRVLLRCVDGRVADAPEAPAASGAAPRGTERLLVVDDHAQVRSVTVRALRALGYEVLEAGDGQQALDLVDADRGVVELLITDVVMPKLGGRDLADALRARRPGLPVLFTSGYAEDAVAHRGVVADGVNLLTKPFHPDELARRVRQLLDEARPA